MTDKKEFVKYQKKWNEDNVEIERFNWQTRNKVIIEKEAKLLAPIRNSKGLDVLEVGCGEGANIENLKGTQKRYTGIDFSKTRIKFAKHHVKNKGSKFMFGDGTKIQFKDNSFDIVFCRDVIHHVWEHDKLINEMYRVCKPGGKVILVESNALNLLNFIFSLAFRKESGMRKIHPRYIRKLFSRLNLDKNMTIEYSESYNLDRFIFHYKMGFPKLAGCRMIRSLNDFINKIFEFITPKIFRAYMIVECQKTRKRL
jgi:ubiquinone/menaquinone biosynthesis C-methylase UbiE